MGCQKDLMILIQTNRRGNSFHKYRAELDLRAINDMDNN